MSLIDEVRAEVEGEEAEQARDKPLGLRAFALNGLTEKLRQEMKEAVFVMDKIAIRGQFVAISGPPNGGKTLFTLKCSLMLLGLESSMVKIFSISTLMIIKKEQS